MNFSQALEEIKAGNDLTRAGWNGKGMYVYLVQDRGSVNLPYIAMFTAQEKYVPWVASHSDLLAEDWSVLA